MTEAVLALEGVEGTFLRACLEMVVAVLIT
jgi:hypothetical protein